MSVPLPKDHSRNEPVYWKSNEPHTLEECCGGTIKAGNRLGELAGDAYDASVAINKRGEIVGRGDFKHDDAGFLLIPSH